MPEISLTEFVDFAIKSGTPKLTEVKRIKAQHKAGYHPTRDYWLKLREGIVEMHQQGQPKSALDASVKGIDDANKQNTYPEMAKAYKKFLGRKEVAWFEPFRANWQYGNLAVRVNPELGLTIDGEPHLVKLYFKDQKLTANRVAIISHMMLDTLRPMVEDAKVALLDVRHSRLYAFDAPDPALVPLLEGEALAFCRMYEGVGQK
jgi:hypothetical protein